MMLFTLEPLRAAEGDCLLLHWGTADNPKLAVIDGGPAQTWETSLRPRLEAIFDHHNPDRLNIDLVMVSHVDNDHIVGIRKLFRELTAELDGGKSANARPLAVRRLWHNTFNDVLDDQLDSYYETLTANLTAIVGGEPNPALEAHLAKAVATRGGGGAASSEAVHDVALVRAGHQEGRQLRDLHTRLRDVNQISALNSPFERNGNPTLISADSTPTPVMSPASM